MSASLWLDRGALSSCRQMRSTLTTKLHGTSTAHSKLAWIASGRPGTVRSRDIQPILAAPVPPRARLVAVGSVAEAVESTPAVADKQLESGSPKVPRIKVAAKSKVQPVAGKISHSAREGELPEVVCVGPTCANIAIKAIAVSRSNLASENMDLSFKPVYGEVGRANDDTPLLGLILQLAKSQTPAPTPPDAYEMHIRSDSKAWRSAGALAARVREQRPIFLTAIGVGAVQTAVLTLSKARQYLQKDLKDIRAVPEFIKVTKEDREVSVMKFNVVVEDLQ